MSEAAAPKPSLHIPTAREIEHDNASLESDIEGAPPAGGDRPNEPHSGSVLHSTPHASMESVADATPIEAVEHDVAATPDVNLGEVSE